jgi:hypothetical protein
LPKSFLKQNRCQPKKIFQQHHCFTFYVSGQRSWTPSSTSTMEGKAWFTAMRKLTRDSSWSSRSITTVCT